MLIPKSITFNNQHSIGIIYKALKNYKEEQNKSAYHYDKYGEKIKSTAYFDAKDAEKAMKFIEEKHYKDRSLNNAD